MRMRKRARIALTALLLALCLTACGISFTSSDHVSSYRATMLVRSETSGSARMSFMTLNGRIVFTLRSGGSDAVGASARVETGSATVYYEAGGTKTEWFTVTAGEEVEYSAGPLEKGTVYVIVETDGKCEEGSFRFEVLDHAAE